MVKRATPAEMRSAQQQVMRQATGQQCSCCGKTTHMGVVKVDVVGNVAYVLCPSCLRWGDGDKVQQAIHDKAKVPAKKEEKVW